MLKILSQRWLVTLLAVIFLSALIWFAGPYVAFADHKPLEGPVARLLCILVLVILWAAWLQWRQIRQQRAGAKLGDALASQPDAAAGGSQGSRSRNEAEQLRTRFEEAVAALRKSGSRGRDLYSLPWYLIIGPPGSGKTTALENSGLRFPLEQKFGSAKLKGVGGTRNCDWWFSDEAILLDTAGRYTTQDSDAIADGAAWGAFLNLLQKHRGRRPINGVMVAISASDLLSGDSKAVAAHVIAVRRRLEELSHHLGVRLPVYFLLTKCDLMAGFMEFFEDLGQDERRQVWGVTFPIADSEQGTAAGGLPRQLDALLQRLESRRLQRLAAETDPARRAAILAFPAQFAALAPALAELVGETFTTSSFDEPVLLRGVYLTSGTQESTPIDRAMGAVARAFGMDAQLTVRSGSGAGRAYFVERLLREVLFREAGLAGINRSVERRLLSLQLATYIGVTILLVCALVGFWVSYRANVAYIESVHEAVGLYKQAPPPLGGVSGARIVEARPRLDAARALWQTAARFADHVPWSMRFGLYRGGVLGDAAHDAYLREIDGSVLPVLGEGFRGAVASSVADPQRLYQFLKAYMMLGDPKKRVDRDQLLAIANAEWRALIPNDDGSRRDLAEHFSALVEDPSRMRALPLDPALVQRSQDALRVATVPQLMFDRLRLSSSVDDKRALHLDSKIAAFADVFIRRSHKPLNEPFPGLYTRAAFDEFQSFGLQRLKIQFESEKWVLGSAAPSVTALNAAGDAVVRIYEQNYIKAWDDLLADLGPRPSKGPDDLVTLLLNLGSPAGPFKQLYKLVDENTDFSAPAAGADKAESALAAAAKAKAAQFDPFGVVSTAPAEVPGASITKHFLAYHALVAGPDGAAPIDATLHSLVNAANALTAAGTGTVDRAKEVSVLKDVKAQAALLPPPIAQLVTDVSTGSETVLGTVARDEFSQAYQQVVRDCREVINGRYPFDANSAIDVPIEDFKRVFGAGGIYDAFFRTNLQTLVDTSHSPWRTAANAGATAVVSPSIIAKFERVQQIRDLFFGPGGTEPKFQFTVTPLTLDAHATGFTLQVDGRTLEYRHGLTQTVPMQWPGAAAGQASVQFEPGAGGIPAFEGPWAWFRLLGRAQLSSQSEAAYQLTFTAGGMNAVVKLDAASIRNPLAHREWQHFRCEG